MFKGRVAKIEIDYIPLSSSFSATRLSFKGVSGNILEHDAYIRAVSGLESVGFETLGGSLSVGGSAYTGVRAHDREVVFTLECHGGESDFRNKVNNLKLLQSKESLYFRVTSTEGSLLHTYGYITDLTAPPFRKEREIQLTFKSPSPYFVEAPYRKAESGIPRVVAPPEGLPPEYYTPWGSPNDERFEVDFSDSELSPMTDIQVCFKPGDHEGKIQVASVGSGYELVAAEVPSPSYIDDMIGYDSLENRIITVYDSDEFLDQSKISYGKPKSYVDLDRDKTGPRDWRLISTRGSWPSPTLSRPKLVVVVTQDVRHTMAYEALIYKKVAGI